MSKYEINKEAIAKYLRENPLDLLSLSDNKSINFNLKISKQDLSLLEVICSHSSDDKLNKKSEVINHVIESLIVNIFNAIDDEYVSFKMAETVDYILRKKHHFYGKDKFSWTNQFIGSEQISQIEYHYELNPDNQNYYKDEYKLLKELLIKYLKKVSENENSK